MHDALGGLAPSLALLHVLAAFAFLLAHGPSVAAMVRLRREKDPAAIRALLELSRQWQPAFFASLVAVGATGAALASIAHVWGERWVWGSAIVLGAVSGVMSPLAARPFNEARHAAGLPWFDGRRLQPSGRDDPLALEAALVRLRRRTPLALAVGVAGAVLLVILMVARPT